jgi:hypothetical protein
VSAYLVATNASIWGSLQRWSDSFIAGINTTVVQIIEPQLRALKPGLCAPLAPLLLPSLVSADVVAMWALWLCSGRVGDAAGPVVRGRRDVCHRRL